MASKDKNQDHPVFKNVVASKRTYAYALLQGKSVWNAEKGYSTRVAPTQIGSIKSKDGIGECVFNINFLSENPEFIPWKVIRVGQGKFEYERRSEAEIKEIKQKLADSQDILDDIKANPSKPGIRTKASVARNSGSATPKTCGTARKFGDYYLLKSFMDKMPSFNILKKIMPDDKYILLVYMIMTCLSKGIKSISYEIEAFVREHALDLDINSYKDHIQRLYKYIDENGVINEFAKFKTQYHKKKNGNKHMQFLALDGTNVDNAGNCLTKAQYGKSKSGTDNKVINFITLVDQSTHELFSTVTYAGNITDVLTVESVCRQLVDRGAGDNISLVCDRGFWSINNISAMLEHNISFVCNCNIAKSKLIKEQVDVISRDLLRDRGLVFSSSADITDTAPKLLAGKTIQLPWSYTQKILSKMARENNESYKPVRQKEKNLYVHFIFSREIYEESMNKYRVLVKELNDAYDIASNWQEVIAGKEPSELTAAHTNLLKDKLVDLFQYSDEVADTDSSFDKKEQPQQRYYPRYYAISRLCRQIATRVLVSDCVDNVIEANEIYAQRNNVEVGYSIIKGELGGSTLNASTDKTVNAKVFILSLASEVQRQMLEANKAFNKEQIKNNLPPVKLCHNSFRGTLRSLEAIEATIDKENGSIIFSGGILKRQSELIRSFGIEPLDTLTRAAYAKEEGFSFKR